ncbi:MAG: PIG-L family deacetylase [Gemmatimonadetes bacterium]|nr:PIG-L family deacetylase [Gemmatimonadota bacterium]
MRVPRRLIAAALVLGVVAPCATRAQERGAVAFDQAVRGLTTTGRVLVIGAHPDDEDTFLIAWLARGRQVETAYLALTRGDGGQNIIGNELGEALGALRTEELLAARRLDGAHQYFSRAYDFGFSKNAEETYKHWDHDSLLGDVVTVVRAFRPQVVVAIFSGTPADGHGHHQVSGLLAKEAFDLAGDTVRFPAAKYGQPWVPSKFYRNARFGRGPRTLTFDVGAYDPVMGRSDAEIAGESRSQHRSQGQGTPQPKGVSVTGVSRVETRVNESTPATAEQSLFDGVDTTFARLVAEAPDSVRAALRAVGAMADSALAAADLRHPERALPQLARATELLQRAVKVRHCGFPSEGFRRTPAAVPCDAAAIDLDASLAIMERRFERAVLAASGVALEATAERELLAFGDSMPVTVSVYNRSHGPVSISNIRLSGTHPRVAMPITVEADSTARTQVNVIGLVDKRPWLSADALATCSRRTRRRRTDSRASPRPAIRRSSPPCRSPRTAGARPTPRSRSASPARRSTSPSARSYTNSSIACSARSATPPAACRRSRWPSTTGSSGCRQGSRSTGVSGSRSSRTRRARALFRSDSCRRRACESTRCRRPSRSRRWRRRNSSCACVARFRKDATSSASSPRRRRASRTRVSPPSTTRTSARSTCTTRRRSTSRPSTSRSPRR